MMQRVKPASATYELEASILELISIVPPGVVFPTLEELAKDFAEKNELKLIEAVESKK